jgi:alkaline phosphatase D
VVHLGDYIYEDGGGQKAYLPIIEKTGRKHEPSHELVTLNDYRTRYKQHRKDTMLQRLHQRYPMINTWDDHEIANDSWKGGVKGRIGDKQGNWNSEKWKQRVENAIKAYGEWIPIHKNTNEPIYRSFKFADLLNLNMLDTRICCRAKQASSKKRTGFHCIIFVIVGRRTITLVGVFHNRNHYHLESDRKSSASC